MMQGLQSIAKVTCLMRIIFSALWQKRENFDKRKKFKNQKCSNRKIGAIAGASFPLELQIRLLWLLLNTGSADILDTDHLLPDANELQGAHQVL